MSEIRSIKFRPLCLKLGGWASKQEQAGGRKGNQGIARDIVSGEHGVRAQKQPDGSP